MFIEALFDDQVTGTEDAAWTAIPRRVEVDRNDPRTADKARITFNYRDFPLDPRVLSAVHVSVYIDDIGANDNSIPKMGPSTLRFQGFVDVPESVLDADEASVTFECRDYTAIYIGKSWRRVADEEPVLNKNSKPTKKTKLKIPRRQTLEQFVQQVRDKARPKGASAIQEPPTVFEIKAVKNKRVDLRAAKNYLNMRDSDTAWDVLTMVCEWFGMIPVWDLDPIDGAVLRIRSASGSSRRLAHLDFGQNIERLVVRRDLQAPERKAIRLLAWNPRTAEVVEGVYPEKGLAEGELANLEKDATLTIGGRVVSRSSDFELQRVQYTLEGDYTEADLIDLATLLYEEQAFGRFEGEVETRHMQDSADASVLGLSNGDRLVLRIGSEITAGIESMSDSEAVLYLADPARPNALPVAVAEALVFAYRQVEELAVELYVVQVTHTWDNEEGYMLTLEFSDFLIDSPESIAGRVQFAAPDMIGVRPL